MGRGRLGSPEGRVTGLALTFAAAPKPCPADEDPGDPGLGLELTSSGSLDPSLSALSISHHDGGTYVAVDVGPRLASSDRGLVEDSEWGPRVGAPGLGELSEGVVTGVCHVLGLKSTLEAVHGAELWHSAWGRTGTPSWRGFSVPLFPS